MWVAKILNVICFFILFCFFFWYLQVLSDIEQVLCQWDDANTHQFFDNIIAKHFSG